MNQFQRILSFLLLSLTLSLVAFGDNLWGRSIAAPVDHAAALWKHFGHVDPESSGIPKNHHIVDQLSYDLPLQWTIYHEWRAGRVPWWSPFTYSGRPLLADAHCNGADPFRVLLYSQIPDFVLAYNWTLAVHHLWLGLGIFVLLQRLRFSWVIAAGVASAAQFAGAFVLYIGHPWVTASFSWYPWIWIAWSAWFDRRALWALLVGPLGAAAVFYSGNLQSHAYLPIFGLAFVLGYGGLDLRALRKAGSIVAFTGLLGALIAAPILGPELELFSINERTASTYGGHWVDGILTLTAAWPWSLGTFRTLGYQSLGFLLFLGAPAAILALMGLLATQLADPSLIRARRCAVINIVAYIVILSSPLAPLFYARSAGLGALGMCMLIAIGCIELLRLPADRARRWANAVWCWVGVLVLGTAAVVYVLYPKFRPRMQQMMDARQQVDGYGERSKALRNFQVESFPNEVGFGNQEVVAGILALAILAFGLRSAVPGSARLAVVLAANLVSPMLFAHRFVPNQPRAMWDRLRDGSLLQQSVSTRLHANQLRLHEEPGSFEQIFPAELAHLFQIHVVQGYAALQPPSRQWRPLNDTRTLADLFHRHDGSVLEPHPGRTSRFLWNPEDQRPITARVISLGLIEISFPPVPTSTELIRTDTYYPGWSAHISDGVLDSVREDLFTKVLVPPNVSKIVFEYVPSRLYGFVALALTAFAFLLIAWAYLFWKTVYLTTRT